MSERAKKIKALVKNPAPGSKFGSDPLDPWSTKANISEEQLDERSPGGSLAAFLKAKGIDPRYVSKDQLVAHSKTGEFQKWVRDHQFQEDADVTRLAKKHDVPESEIEAQLKKGQNIEHEHTKDDAKALKIAKDHVEEIPDYYSRLEKMEKKAGVQVKEDVYQDPKAATQTVFDGANNTNDLGEKRKQLSKSARLIKAIYKHNRVVKEDLYDRDKDDKGPGTYGKAPKMDKADPKDSKGENKPKAAAVMSGGKTLTGQDRDDIEIDPMMRVRPGQPDPTKKDDKKDDKEKDKTKKDK